MATKIIDHVVILKPSIGKALAMLGLSITTWSIILVAIIWGMLLFGGYKLLDGMAKWIMSALTIATVAAVIIAAIKHQEVCNHQRVTCPR